MIIDTSSDKLNLSMQSNNTAVHKENDFTVIFLKD